ncbi:MAG: response regulator [Pyrinomonadaceae bacterium]|nr:response regulator [Sphingobacteriaceae bacterium]
MVFKVTLNLSLRIQILNSPMRNMIIAVIDDDPLDRQICARLIKLTFNPESVLEFSNGQDALRHYFTNADLPYNLPDIVIVDIKMPLMNGWEYLQAYEIMETRLNKKPVHYICTSSIDPKELNYREDIVERVFTKPFEKRYVDTLIEDFSQKNAKL